MKNILRTITALCIIMSLCKCANAHAHEPRWYISSNANFMFNGAYNLELGAAYNLRDYAMFELNAGVLSTIDEYGLDGWIYDDYSDPLSVYLRPSLILWSPTLFPLWGGGVRVMFNPSVVVGTTFCVDTEYADDYGHWHDLSFETSPVYFVGQVGPQWRCNGFDFTLFYSLSTIDMDRCYDSRGNYRKRLCHGIGIRLAYGW